MHAPLLRAVVKIIEEFFRVYKFWRKLVLEHFYRHGCLKFWYTLNTYLTLFPSASGTYRYMQLHGTKTNWSCVSQTRQSFSRHVRSRSRVLRTKAVKDGDEACSFPVNVFYDVGSVSFRTPVFALMTRFAPCAPPLEEPHAEAHAEALEPSSPPLVADVDRSRPSLPPEIRVCFGTHSAR